GAAPGGENIGRNFERWLGPAQFLARALDFFFSERRTVAFFAALFGRCAEADARAAGDQRGTSGYLCGLERGRDGVRVVPVDTDRCPARRFKPLDLVDRIRKRERAVDRYAVVVEQHDQLVESQMPGKRNRFLAEALHEV